MKMFVLVLKSQCISATDKIKGFRFDLKEKTFLEVKLHKSYSTKEAPLLALFCGHLSAT